MTFQKVAGGFYLPCISPNMAEDIDKPHRLTKESFSESNHTLAWINGVINRMTKDDLRIQLQLLGLDDR